jgi:predicted thioesterase
MEIEIGKAASVGVIVDEFSTAIAAKSGSLPVFATPMMVALMEHAACECLAGYLDEGQTSVGSAISVEHTAPSPLGAIITATAVIESVSGRKVEFSVSASDNAGEIGKGAHTRIIVDGERLCEKAAGRV